MCTNKDISAFLNDVSLSLELLGENSFKVSSFLKAARIAESFEESLFDYAEEGKLKSIKGIGDAIAENIKEFCQKGTSGYYLELKEKIPVGVFDIFKIKGLGAKKIKELWTLLDIKSIPELEYACVENRLISLKGFGQKTQDKITYEIEKLKSYKDFMLLSEAEVIFKETVEKIQATDKSIKLEASGDFRRRMPVIKEIILISNKEIANKESLGLHKSINIITTDDKSFAKVLFETTGSEPHINSLGELEGNFQSEEEIYRVKGFHFIAPEMREAEYDISSFSKDKPAWDLVEENDIKGVVHSHTTYSDGANTPEELACFCRDNGYEYLCISDHSKSAYYAGGLKEDDILRQRDEIAALNEKLMPFKIFAGIESDILKDGSLDYSDETLKSFDFVIASVHSVFNLPKDDMTKRIVNAANNPYTTILGHPTGRLLLGRESYLLDMEQIADACIKSGTVIEINANPHRLDMDWKEIIKSREKGGLFSINPDAHSLNGIFHIRFGVSIARKGGLRASNVINTKSASEIGAFFRGQKGK